MFIKQGYACNNHILPLLSFLICSILVTFSLLAKQNIISHVQLMRSSYLTFYILTSESLLVVSFISFTHWIHIMDFLQLLYRIGKSHSTFRAPLQLPIEPSFCSKKRRGREMHTLFRKTWEWITWYRTHTHTQVYFWDFRLLCCSLLRSAVKQNANPAYIPNSF